MSDIVERLKYCAEHGLIDAASSEMAAGYGEAAAEIEKLRAELEKSRQDWERVDTAHSFRVHESEMRQVDIFALEAENEKLREELLHWKYEVPEMTDTIIARIMWDAYAVQAGGKTFDGKPLPTWEELGEERQACWLAAANAAAAALKETGDE